MLLPASLTQTTLGDVLGRLLRDRVSGILALFEPSGRQHQVHLLGGAPRAVASDGPRLGELSGLEPTLLSRAHARQRMGDDRLFGELLRELGAGAREIEDVVARQCRERLDRLFGVREARLAFHATVFEGGLGEEFQRAARSARGLSMHEFLYGRPRRRDSEAPRIEDARRDALRALGVTSEASAADVRSAFKRLVLELHPDRATSEDDRRERTRRLARLTAMYQRASVA